jgi:hypothetical protein
MCDPIFGERSVRSAFLCIPSQCKAELDELQVRFTELSMGMSMPHPDGLNSLDEVPDSSADDESMSMSDFGS